MHLKKKHQLIRFCSISEIKVCFCYIIWRFITIQSVSIFSKDEEYLHDSISKLDLAWPETKIILSLQHFNVTFATNFKTSALFLDWLIMIRKAQIDKNPYLSQSKQNLIDFIFPFFRSLKWRRWTVYRCWSRNRPEALVLQLLSAQWRNVAQHMPMCLQAPIF